MPTFQVSFFETLLWLIVGWMLALMWQLALSAMMAKVARFHVAACGIGSGRVLLRFHLGKSVLFLAPMLLQTPVVVATEQLRPSRRALITLALGPLLAGLLLAMGAVAAWSAGFRHPLIPALFYASLVQLLLQLPPLRWRRKNGLAFKSAGMNLLQLLKGTHQLESWPGPTLAVFHALRKFCREIDAPLGTVYYTLLLAMDQAWLGDVEAARETLGDTCLDDLRRGEFGNAMEAYARAVLAVAEQADDVDAKIVKAIERCQQDPVALACLSLLLARWTHLCGGPAEELAQAAVEDAAACRHADLVTAARMFLLEVAPTENLAANADALLALRSLAQARPAVTLRFLVALVRQFAARGQLDEVRRYFAQAQPLLMAIARDIPNPQTRAIYLAKEGRPLRDVIVEHDPDVPLFLPVGPAVSKPIAASA